MRGLRSELIPVKGRHHIDVVNDYRTGGPLIDALARMIAET